MRVNWIVVHIKFSLRNIISNRGLTFSKYFAREKKSIGFKWFCMISFFPRANIILGTFMNVRLNHNIRHKNPINFDMYLLNGIQYKKNL
jgi:hypothetical protein